MDPAARHAATEETLALIGQLQTLTRELEPLQAQYRSWAREYQQTLVPHDRGEFNALLDRIKELKDQIASVRAALNALAALGGRR